MESSKASGSVSYTHLDVYKRQEERAAKAAEREAERAQKAAEKEAERAARAAEKQREQAMKTVSSVIGQIGRETSRQLLRGLFGNLRK